uniref:Transposase, MuDR, MULE transposase domain protein n=1 Tax=Tanacetum cinerariifolium TaxID=118510 RepID=A0A6L2LUQ7_TANCI|nr:transposase, MuDR, MULE transposase domain protein [Tanacetum cinerariifolium]
MGAIDRYKVYHVDDHRMIHAVELYSGTCTCRKWKVSGLPYGHVLAVCRVMGLIDFNHLAKGWFRRKALEGTYQELVYPVGEVSSWQRPNYFQAVKPTLMDKKPAGRPKSIARIRSQGEEPVPVTCRRCGARGHNQNSCRETIP